MVEPPSKSQAQMSVVSTLKYRTLRYPLGRLGNYYDRKDKKSVAHRISFSKAVRHSSGLTCIDCSASVGLCSRMMAYGKKLVVAFELEPRSLEQLQSNVADMQIVRASNCAVGRSDESAFLPRHRQVEQNPEMYSKSGSVYWYNCDFNKERPVKLQQVDLVDKLEKLDQEIGVFKDGYRRC